MARAAAGNPLARLMTSEAAAPASSPPGVTLMRDSRRLAIDGASAQAADKRSVPMMSSRIPDFSALPGGEDLALADQPDGRRDPGQARQALGAAGARYDAEPRLGQAEGRGRRGEPAVRKRARSRARRPAPLRRWRRPRERRGLRSPPPPRAACGGSGAAFISRISAPAMNRPAPPEITIAVTPESAASDLKASREVRRAPPREIALTGGLATVTTATSPRRATDTGPVRSRVGASLIGRSPSPRLAHAKGPDALRKRAAMASSRRASSVDKGVP